MIHLVFNNTSYALPETWEDLPNDDFLNLFKILSNENSIEEAKVKLIYTLGKIKPKHFFGNKFNPFLQHQILELAESYNPTFFTKVFSKNYLPIAEIKNKFPFSKTKLMGPTEYLSDCTANEIDKAYYFYDCYNSTQEVKYLVQFFVCLWRPYEFSEKYKKKIRVPFDEEMISTHTNSVHLSSYNITIMSAALFIFRNIMVAISQVPNWEDVFKNKGKESSEATDWNKIFRSIASDKIGSHKEVKQMPFVHVLDELQYLEVQRELIESQKTEN